MALAREEAAEELGEPLRLVVRDEVAGAGDDLDGELGAELAELERGASIEVAVFSSYEEKGNTEAGSPSRHLGGATEDVIDECEISEAPTCRGREEAPCRLGVEVWHDVDEDEARNLVVPAPGGAQRGEPAERGADEHRGWADVGEEASDVCDEAVEAIGRAGVNAFAVPSLVDGEYPPPAGTSDRRCDRIPHRTTFSTGVQEDDRIESGPTRRAERPISAAQLDLVHYFGIPK